MQFLLFATICKIKKHARIAGSVGVVATVNIFCCQCRAYLSS
jgi:hypothetical protein